MRKKAYCDICGKYEFLDEHHLWGGTSNRKKSDINGLTVDICGECHRFIHYNTTANKLSKMLAQALFEIDHTREESIKTFGKNLLPNK